MAIQTQGYQIRNMPKVGLANPSLVAFNPNAASDGLLQTFKIAQAYDQLKANKALQAELEATRQARIAQTNALADFDVARTQAQTPTLGPKAALDIAQSQNAMAMLEPRTRAEMAQLELDTSRNRAAMPNVGPLAELEGAKAKQTLRTLEPVTNAQIAAANAQKAQSDVDLEQSPTRALVKEAEMEVSLEKLSDQILNAKTDAEQARAAKRMDLLLKNSQVIENLGRAEYYQQPKAGAKGQSIANQIAALQLAKQRLETAPYTLPDGTQAKGLSAYRGQVYDEKGGVKQTRSFPIFGDKSPVREDPNARDAIQTSARIDQAINSLLPHLITEISGGPIPAAQEAPKAKISDQDQAALNWAQDPKNAKSPHLQGVLNKLRQKGIIQ